MSLAQLQRFEKYFDIFKLNHAGLTDVPDLNREDDYFKSSFFQNVEDLYIENKNQFDKFLSQHYGLNKPLQNPTSNLDFALFNGRFTKPILPELSGEPLDRKMDRKGQSTVIDHVKAQPNFRTLVHMSVAPMVPSVQLTFS